MNFFHKLIKYLANLEKILIYVHPKVVDAYRNHDFEYIPTAKDSGRYIFEKKSKGRPRNRKINSIYRKRLASGEEYLMYGYTLRSTDFNDNRITFYDFAGQYNLPVFQKTRNSAGDIISTEIQDYEPQYEYPFTREELEKIIVDIDENTWYCVETPSRKYSIPTLEDLQNRSFDDLVEYGRTGKFPDKEDSTNTTGKVKPVK